MVTQGNLHTASEGHAVKEAVVTFFVTPMIREPQGYAALLESSSVLRDSYQKFEPIKQIEVKIVQGIGGNTERRDLHDAGFKMIAYQNGHTSDIIQGINQPDRSLFTFNTVNYAGWTSFYEHTMSVAKAIAQFKPIYVVKAFSLLFIDEFYYDNKADYNPIYLFNQDSSSLPKDVLKSKSVDYSLNVSKKKEDKDYIENLSVKVIDEKMRKTIQIVDNVAFVINPTPWTDLLNNESFKSFLDFAHSENKHMLRDVLNKQVCDLINL